MSLKGHSPTAHLLRNSRLFSLPPSLPRPAEKPLTQVSQASESATLPYPIAAAIVTPPSSLVRGDWGLKRPLPLKSTTATSTPVVRVGPVDSIVEITDFFSAADTSLTLKKWQELAQPMSEAAMMLQAHSTVRREHEPFRWDLDSTAPGTTHAPRRARRWKFGGPWLAGQTEAEFERFVVREVRRRKDEFRKHLRRHCRAWVARTAAHDSRQAGRYDADAPDPAAAVEVGDLDLERYTHWLRGNPETLYNLLAEFLDMPAFSVGDVSSDSRDDRHLEAIYTVMGPPKTHPSGGLSYLRTASVLSNDPVRGPQRCGAPVEARVLMPRRQGFSVRRTIIGVGGVVTHDLDEGEYRSDAVKETDAVYHLDPNAVGGGKVRVQVTRLGIDARGRLRVSAERVSSSSGAAESRSLGLGRGDYFGSTADRQFGIPPLPPAWDGRQRGAYGLGSPSRGSRGASPWGQDSYRPQNRSESSDLLRMEFPPRR